MESIGNHLVADYQVMLDFCQSAVANLNFLSEFMTLAVERSITSINNLIYGLRFKGCKTGEFTMIARFSSYLSVPETTRNQIDKILSKPKDIEETHILEVKAKWFTRKYSVVFKMGRPCCVLDGNHRKIEAKPDTTPYDLLNFINTRIALRGKDSNKLSKNDWQRIEGVRYFEEDGIKYFPLNDLSRHEK
ncbi:hypothetical protein D5018_15135 [Parashewanella curva]|uniref:Uncharacterized protein n=1 Tax=Parashewanella curva TaxID=2338552 RepID=A0A3L8PTU7_9GAMM|nr:hypothetical protein [Parashewanella curva]RLV58837.1 hypothetical protein D5018_15135 [Parashewanella curva]